MLKESVYDFVYIAGGHSYDTVKFDHCMVKDSKIIVFDDVDLKSVKSYVFEFLIENKIKKLPYWYG